MASIFWDAKGVLLIDYLEKGKTLTLNIIAHLLDQLDKIFVKKDPVYRRKQSFFHQDNSTNLYLTI